MTYQAELRKQLQRDYDEIARQIAALTERRMEIERLLSLLEHPLAESSSPVSAQPSPRRKPGPRPGSKHGLPLGYSTREWAEIIAAAFGNAPFTVGEFTRLPEVPMQANPRNPERARILLNRMVEERLLTCKRSNIRKVTYSLAPRQAMEPAPERPAPQTLQDSLDAYARQNGNHEPVRDAIERGTVMGVNGNDRPPAWCRKVIASAVRAGWVASRNGDGHWALAHPKRRNKRVSISTTPSDPRAVANLRASLRRVGAPV
jgi:hypothetical protein